MPRPALVTIQSHIWTSSGDPITFNITPSGAYNAVVVGAFWRANSGQTVSGMSYDGNALTSIGAGSNTLNNGAGRVFGAVSAAGGGSKVVSIDFSAGVAKGVAFCLCLNNVHQTTPFDGYTQTGGNSTTPSRTVSSATGKAAMAFMGCENDAVTFTEGAGLNILGSEAAVPGGGADSGYRFEVADKDGAASTVMDWTISATAQWLEMAFNINDGPDAGAGGAKHPLVNVHSPLTSLIGGGLVS